MAHENPFEIKTKSDGSYFGSYTDPRINIMPIRLTNGASSGMNLNKENNSVINNAMAQATGPQSGFNRNLKKRIKGADNIAQQTRLNIKLDKKEQRQEKRAQKMLDRNPEYTRKPEKERRGEMKKVQNRNMTFHPTNIPKLREI